MSKRVWDTESNSLAKSKYIMSTEQPSSRDLVQQFKVVSNWVTQDLLAVKPYW